MRLPSLKFLKTFQVAAKHKSFKAAAEELFVTPSAVSHQIKSLEEQLGVALFERGVRTLTLTDAGAHYLEHISDIFSKLESVTEQLQVRYGRTIIRLNVPPFFANELLLPRLASFTQAREETDIRIETTFSAPKTHPAGSGPVHRRRHGPLGGTHGARAVRAELHRGVLAEFSARKPDRRLCRPERQDPAAARGAARCVGALGAGAQIAPIKPNRLVRLDTMSAVVLAAEQGVGVALVPARFSADRFAAGAW